jgi:hypothetical protein
MQGVKLPCNFIEQENLKMAGFTSTNSNRPKAIGTMRMSFGRYDDDATGGGDIDTGLNMCHSIMLSHEGSAIEAKVAVVNETLPVDGSAVTIVCENSDTGYWLAFGY